MKTTPNTNSAERGFTVLEILIVIVVVGVLSSLTLSRFFEAGDRGHIGAAQYDLTAVRQALAIYHVDHTRFPEALPDMKVLRSLVTDANGNQMVNLPSGNTFRWLDYKVLDNGDYALRIQALDNQQTVLVATPDRISFER